MHLCNTVAWAGQSWFIWVFLSLIRMGSQISSANSALLLMGIVWDVLLLQDCFPSPLMLFCWESLGERACPWQFGWATHTSRKKGSHQHSVNAQCNQNSSWLGGSCSEDQLQGLCRVCAKEQLDRLLAEASYTTMVHNRDNCLCLILHRRFVGISASSAPVAQHIWCCNVSSPAFSLSEGHHQGHFQSVCQVIPLRTMKILLFHKAKFLFDS